MPAKKKAVVWSDRTTNEYLATLDYIMREWGSVAAEKFENTVFDMVERLARDPAQFPLANSKRAVRRCVVTYQNSIFFREQNSGIEILAFFDTRQHPGKLKL